MSRIKIYNKDLKEWQYADVVAGGGTYDDTEIRGEIATIREGLDSVDSRLSESIVELQEGGYVADQQRIAEKINAWLVEHPEATTTVQDGSLTLKKFKIGEVPFVTPEMFGAIGDGDANDTGAVSFALGTGLPVFLKGIYKIASDLQCSASVFGNGTLVFSNDLITFKVSGNAINVNGITFDYNQHEGRMFKLENASNVCIENCSFKNVGKLTDNYSNTSLWMDYSKNVIIKNCKFERCYSIEFASFIWVSNSEDKTPTTNILIDNCYFEDCQPIANADAVKVLGYNTNCYMTVSNCRFKDCRKRAMKFQGRYCHSENNYIECNYETMYPIDFQRGYGTSKNDTIVFVNDGTNIPSGAAGLSLCGIAITQGHVDVEGLKIICKYDNAFPLSWDKYTSSRAIYFNYIKSNDADYGQFSDTSIVDVNVKNCSFDGFGRLFMANDRITEIKDCTFEDIKFYARSSTVQPWYFRPEGQGAIKYSVLRNIIINGSMPQFGLNMSEGIFNSIIDLSYDGIIIPNFNNNDFRNRSKELRSSNFEVKGGRLKVWLNGSNANPSGSTSSAYRCLRGCPVGTIAYTEGLVENSDGTYTYGFICTEQGTSGAVGTMIPLKYQ